MEPNEKPAEGAGLEGEEPESRAVGILLNAPNIVSKLVDTAVLLSLLTGILYAWGWVYYGAFIEGLGLERYTFGFNPSSQEVLLGGANALSFLITGVPLAYWSVSLALTVIIIIVGVIQLILVPVLTKAALYLKPLLKGLGRRAGRKLKKFRILRKLRELLAKFKPEQSALDKYERSIKRVAGSVELYVVHAVVTSLLLLLLILGVEKSRELGLKAAEQQLRTSPHVEVLFGDNEKIESTLCGRIGGDYILRSVEPKGNYVIVKEATIKRITILKP